MEKYSLPENIDLDNPEFRNLESLINNTNHSVFLTGKAGTGKSTFLKYICNTTKKKYVVLAPTGIAAVNVGGMTLHSFFKLPFKPLLIDDPDFSIRNIRKTLKYSHEKVKLIKSVDLIIIDEISMVRADIIDFIDKVLKVYCQDFRHPFGGKQLLLVGDVFQLGPVVNADMKKILNRYYTNFYFFNANIFKIMDIVSIELVKCYRQTNSDFVRILDSVRINEVTKAQIDQLNTRFDTPEILPEDKLVVTLATRRDIVSYTNDLHLKELEGEEFTYTGKINEDFPIQNLPTDEELHLKVGAQIIFVRNDREHRWVNGTLGKIVELSDDSITVATEDGSEYILEPTVWENISYKFNEEKNVIESKVLGTFVQFPVKTAWAITVHKSQGLTFNNVILDFGEGAFSPGQTYVALSRCTSLDGIVLKKKLNRYDVFTDRDVVAFSKNFNDKLAIDNALKFARNEQNIKDAAAAIGRGEIDDAINLFFKVIDAGITKFDSSGKRLIRRKINSLASAMLLNKEDKGNEILEEFADEFYELGINSLHIGGIDYRPDNFTILYPTPKDEIAVKSAFANFDKALKANPKHIKALKAKIDLFIIAKEYDAAVELMSLIDEDNSVAMWKSLTLAKIFLLKDDVENAIRTLNLVLRKNRTRPEPHEMAALIWEMVGEPDLAEAHREKAKKYRNKKSGSK